MEEASVISVEIDQVPRQALIQNPSEYSSNS
jgi:hypothetical protein